MSQEIPHVAIAWHRNSRTFAVVATFKDGQSKFEEGFPRRSASWDWAEREYGVKRPLGTLDIEN